MKAKKTGRQILAWTLTFLLCFGGTFSSALADGIEGISEVTQEEMVSPGEIPGDESDGSGNVETLENTGNAENPQGTEDPAGMEAGVTYDPQPETMADVRAAIEVYEVEYRSALEAEGVLAALQVLKPHWQYEVAAELMPVGWNCQLVDWDMDFGANYYTFFPSPVTMATTTILPPGSTATDLQNAINSAASGDFIEISSDIAIGSTPISIPSGLDITIQSASGGTYALTQSNANARHLRINGNLTLQDIILDGGNIGGGVYVAASGTLVMNDGTVIQNCSPTTDQACVYVYSGTFNMYGGEIKSNACHGVFVMYNGTFNMYGGIIGGYNPGDGNTATNWGGGVGIYYGSSFTMYNGEIVGNKAEGGGGVFMYQNYGSYQNNSFTMKGGLIHGNQGTGPYYSYGGGGVLMWGGTFIMEGGAITDNAAYAGGGILSVYASTEVYIYDGEISGNTADIYGGGICVSGMLELGDLTGTQAGTQIIKGNTAVYGGGVFVNASLFTMGKSSGSAAVTPVIAGNTAYHSGGGVYVSLGTFDMYDGTIGGATDGNEASFGGGAYIYGSPFNMYGGELIGNAATDTYTSLLTNPPGNPGLGGGICLGYAQLNIYNGKINGNAATLAGGGIYSTFGASGSNGTTTFQYSNINLYDGEINGNTAGGNGGGVYMAGGTFRMENGEISNNGGALTVNNSSYGPAVNGGGVYFPHGDFEMCDGAISNNIATGNGGGVCAAIQIVDRTSSNGGRYVFAGNLSMGDPSGVITAGAPVIDGNTAGGNGGGIYLSQIEDNATTYSGTFVTVAGITCAITNNSAVGDGGGIYTNDTTYVNLTTNSNTIFSGNTASCYYTDAVASSYPNVQSASVSIPATFALNNYDINYTGYFTLTYVENGATSGTTPVDNTNYLLGTTATVAGSGTLNRPGYTFTGWNTAANGSGTAYAPDDSITVTGSVTLYAQWEKDANQDILETEDHIPYLFGYPDSSVRADNAITRAEAASIFYRLLREQGTAAGGQFSDVGSSEWYAQAVNYLASIGILSGYPDGSFKPNNPITRAEFATIASRLYSLASADSNVFSDVSSGHWAISYINSAYAKGWINGYPDGTFRPENSITRAEVVTIVNAMLDRKIDDEALALVPNPYNDIASDHWSYPEIIEASVVHDYERNDSGKEIWLSW